MEKTLTEVTKEEFFSYIYDNNLDVHPRPEETVTIWEFRGFRTEMGRSFPGYTNAGLGPKVWMLWK